ncbi:MAG: response regulator [Ferruginibacter sp.]
MTKKPLFFLADDDVDDQEFFISALHEIDAGIECITAADGIEALEKLQDNKDRIPDFIFLDQNMPRVTGIQCLREIKKIEALKNVPVIMCSTSHADKDNEEAKKLGVNYIFRKTPSFKEMVVYLKKLIADSHEL